MLFRSLQPDVHFPTDLTVWQWAFEDKRYSPLYTSSPSDLGGFTNAITKERVSFADVKNHATHLSTALVRRYGFREADTVSLFSQNTIWYPVAMHATLRVGGRLNGASPAYNVEEMTHALKTASTKFLFTVPNSIKVAVAAADLAGLPRHHVFLLEGEHEGFTTMKELLAIGRSYGESAQVAPYSIPKGQKNKDVCGFLNFSSGTTGLPKAVMLSHQNVIAQAHQLKAITSPEMWKCLAQLPLFHITGLVRFLTCPLIQNLECYMLPTFTMSSFLDAIVEFQIADLTLVPPIVIRLVHDPIVDKYDLRCLKRLASGSAPTSAEIIELLGKKFPWTGFRQGYGMTESCACISAHPPEYYDYKYANCGGMLCASTVAKVIDVTTGKELGYRETGEILAKGPQIAMGYLNNPEATAESFDADGFLHTGDVGYMDDEGFIHVVDRIKEMIKVKGQQVAPAELEDHCLGHPDVEDAAVLGIPDDYSGERPKAYVVLRPGLKPSVEIGKKLMKYVQENKVRYKWLKELEFTNAVPKSPSGKILRRILKEQDRSGKNRGLVVKDDREKSRL